MIKRWKSLNATLILFLFSKIFHLYSLLSFLLLLIIQPGTLSYFLSLCISLSYQKHSLNHTRISMLRPSMVEDFCAISMIFDFSQQKFSFVLKYQQIHIKKISFNFSFHFFSLVVHSKFFSFEFRTKIAVVILESAQFIKETGDLVVCLRSRSLNTILCNLFSRNCK